MIRKEIDWEQRRYEIAKECLANNIEFWRSSFNYSRQMRPSESNATDGGDVYKYTAECALLYADALKEGG